MIVSGSLNNKTDVYKNLYKCYKKCYKRDYDFCVTHSVLTVVVAFLITCLLKLFGMDIHLDIALGAHIACGVVWFFSDRYALWKRFRNHEWTVEAGYVTEESPDRMTEETVSEEGSVRAEVPQEDVPTILSKLDLHFYAIKNLQGDFIGLTLKSNGVNEDFEDGALIWYNLELSAVFRREQKTTEGGGVK